MTHMIFPAVALMAAGFALFTVKRDRHRRAARLADRIRGKHGIPSRNGYPDPHRLALRVRQKWGAA